MQTILLTGSNGLLGQKIVELLANRSDIRFVATAKGENRHTLKEGYLYESADITDASVWAALFAQYKPDVLIHAAAATQVDICEKDHTFCDTLNVDATQLLADLCAEYKTRMVYISTDFIFDGEKGYYEESDTPNPVNYYGLSKWKAEKIVQSTLSDYAILRTVLVYGYVKGLGRTNIVLWMKEQLSQGNSIRVVNDQERCPTLAEDLAEASVVAALGKSQGIFHVSGAEAVFIHELAHRAARYWNLDESLIQETDSISLNQPAKRPPRTAFSIAKAQRELAYKPRTLELGFALLDQQMKEK